MKISPKFLLFVTPTILVIDLGVAPISPLEPLITLVRIILHCTLDFETFVSVFPLDEVITKRSSFPKWI